MKRALVLSGGGARGSYQFGVWKALRELNINFDIVTGSSIGAANGALISQNDFTKAEEVWKKLNTKDVFYFDYDLHSYTGQSKFYIEIAKALLKDGGIKQDRMSELLNTYIDEERVRNSNIDYGLITYSFTKKKPIVLKLKDIPKGKLVDYVIASATCFPVVKPKEIGNEKFLDGGYYDVMPINLAIEMGAEEVIAVDLKSVGIKRKVSKRNINVVTIAPSTDIGSFLSFSPDDAKFRIALGYNDTMKKYDMLDGNIYTFKKNELNKNYQKLIKTYQDIFNTCLTSETNRLKKIFSNILYNGIHKNINNKKFMLNEFNTNIDNLGKIYKMNVTDIYNIKDFNKELINRVCDGKVSKRNLKDKIITEALYHLVIKGNSKKLIDTAIIFANEFADAMYLATIYQKINLFKRISYRHKLMERMNKWQ